MKVYAVIDTNVLVSALLKWDSVPGRVVQFVYASNIVPVFNEDILAEYNEVLRRPKFHFPENAVAFLISKIKEIGILLTDVEKLEGDFPDPKDIVFFEVTMESGKANDTFLVTGNAKHFPKHPKVVSPAQMLELLNA